MDLKNQFVTSLAHSGTNIIAGTNNGIFVSTDNGISWTQASEGLEGMNSTYIINLMVKGEYLFAGVLDGVYQAKLNDIITSVDNTNNLYLLHGVTQIPHPIFSVFQYHPAWRIIQA